MVERVFGVSGEVLFVKVRCGCGRRWRGRGGVAVGGRDEHGVVRERGKGRWRWPR